MTYEELCDDKRYIELMNRCQNLPISKVLSYNTDEMWPDMPEYLKESFYDNLNPDEIYYVSIIDIIDEFFLLQEESITSEQRDEVLDWALKLKDINLIYFIEKDV